MVHALLSGAIGVMAIAFLAFCYQGFARTKKELETSGSHVVHPLGQIDFFRKPQTAPLYLLFGVLIATILTALIYVQSNRQSMRQLEQQIQQLRQQVKELQSHIATVPNEHGMTGEKNTAPGAAILASSASNSWQMEQLSTYAISKLRRQLPGSWEQLQEKC